MYPRPRTWDAIKQNRNQWGFSVDGKSGKAGGWTEGAGKWAHVLLLLMAAKGRDGRVGSCAKIGRQRARLVEGLLAEIGSKL